MSPRRYLTAAEAAAFYDRLGTLQDTQAFYENPALEVLMRRSDFSAARQVFEFGFGTGRLAERLLERELPTEARYCGIDVSSKMLQIAEHRLARFGDRARLARSDGSMRLPFPDGAFDRFVSSYVFDLLSDTDAAALLVEASRVLSPQGRLCTVSLGFGSSGLSRLVTRCWNAVHARSPGLVGGCRPIQLTAQFAPGDWEIRHREIVSSWGVASEVVVAERAG